MHEQGEIPETVVHGGIGCGKIVKSRGEGRR